MTTVNLMLALVGIMSGGVVGWLLVPLAADVLLKRVYRRTASWWWDSWRAYRSFKSTHPHDDPSASASGEEGALGIWLADALRSMRAGSLTQERVRALADIGIPVNEECALRSEVDQELRCSFTAKCWQRVLCACAGAAWGGALVVAGLPALPSSVLAICALSMTVAMVCDLRARLLPLECCVTLAIAGGVFQVWVAGVSGLAVGAVFGLVIGAACLVANHLFSRSGAAPVGLGDVRCMAALSLTCGVAVPVGLAVCYVGAAVFSVMGLVMKRLTIRDGIPMAPFLILWLIAGVGVLTCT